jgi:hypothetical protein
MPPSEDREAAGKQALCEDMEDLMFPGEHRVGAPGIPHLSLTGQEGEAEGAGMCSSG